MRRGFTIVEVLIVLGITAIMGVLVYNALFVSMKSVKIVDTAFRMPKRALMVSRVLERELTGIYLPEYIEAPAPEEGKEPPPRISERIRFGVIGKSREIHFTTMIPPQDQIVEKYGDILEIGYEFDSKNKKLKKRVDPFPDENLDKGGEKVDFDLYLDTIEFEYYDTKWQDSWDSTKSNTIPRAIRVTLELIEVEDREKYTEEELKAMVLKHQILVLLPNAVENRRRF
ncbi:MAG: prepilin-type N-terminal cleavage/methylation domain-containing protein [Candidatus Cloacimonetes bacterium]|nr:prepilin-type N-terminal cleavage/methylation domain-containing protein [Candidatus Cloacimonadota bacterium]